MGSPVVSVSIYSEILLLALKEGDRQYSLHNTYTESKYFTIKQSGISFFFFLRDKKASWLFFNGLRKNLTSLEDARLTVKGTPEFIAISERKLKEKETFIILAYRGMFFRLLIHEQVKEV